MKLVFTFTDTPDLSALSKDDIYNTSFEIPDEALHLIGVEQRIIKIAEIVGQLTHASLHITCKELNLVNYVIKQASAKPQHRINFSSISLKCDCTIVCFVRRYGRNKQTRLLKILSPNIDYLSRTYFSVNGKRKRDRTLAKNLKRIATHTYPIVESEKTYIENLQAIVEQLLILLNAEPVSDYIGNWKSIGFHPRWIDDNLVKRHEKRLKQIQAEAIKRQKAEARRKAREEKLSAEGKALPSETPKTGAGRRPGAVPGVFMGVQMRSQLEIRFAAELEKRQIKWVYEAERLSDGNYLVDFYLPEYGAWVEVKGTFEPRDEYLLKDVAAYLKKEREQRLFVYTSRKPFLVNPSGFKELTRDEFWNRLLQ